MSVVGRMILVAEKARAAGSHPAVAEDSILQAGKLLERVEEKGRSHEP